HRRFFNVTGLIGMRVEEQSVFDAMHRKVVEFARAGLIHGVRVDHVDGLVDPGGYLERLRDALGVAPIWIEKILTRDETLPDWPVVGTTGYEAARKLTQLLTDGLGQAQIVEDWRTATGRDESFHDVLMAAKAEVMQNELAAELHQLIALSEAALEAEGALHGPEAVREAVLALLSAVPRYRTYFLGRQGSDEDRALFDAVRVEAGETVRIPATIDAIHSLIADPTNANAVALQARFQQVTGALLAKAHEDTAGFRWNAYLASNEVGAEPDEATITVEGFGAWLSTQGALGLTLTSSHDTKRSEDARMRLAAISHLPEAFGTLWLGAQALPEAEAADANMCWFAVQSALAIWQPDAPDTADRLTDHLSKAVREGKELSNWTVPDLEAEAALHAFAAALVRDWQRETPGALNALVARGARLSLVQTALKMVMPGVPDIYGEAVGEHLALTDPDNRRPVTPEALDGLAKAPGFTGQKARLTEQLLAMRLAYPGFFSAANCACEEVDGVVTLRRSFEGADLVLTFRRDGGDLSPEVAWRDDVSAVPLPVGVRWGETG
ncbi:MAG: malto-oligosyltrehalose synthase, partial [Pseudomonadota bacterium]